MERFEYKFEENEREIKNLGQEGWELCSESFNFGKHIYIFKREII